MPKKATKKKNDYDILSLAKYVSFFLLLCYVYGFIAWNYLLSKFSFFEYSLLQTRYLSAGLLFLLIILTILLLIYFVLKPFSSKLLDNVKKHVKICGIVFLLILIPIDIYIFSPTIFFRTEQYLGGAHPFAISIIGSDLQIEYLTNFNIPAAANADITTTTPEGDLATTSKASVQTGMLCGIYQNNDFIIIGVVDDEKKPRRRVTLRQDQIMGVSIPDKESVKDFESACLYFLVSKDEEASDE